MPETRRPADAAGSAMLRAVVAEQDAREAIAAAEVQAAKDIDAARTRAREILNAVPSRIERLRLRGERATAALAARLAGGEPS
jgi:hypothetical protein